MIDYERFRFSVGQFSVVPKIELLKGANKDEGTDDEYGTGGLNNARSYFVPRSLNIPIGNAYNPLN